MSAHSNTIDELHAHLSTHHMAVQDESDAGCYCSDSDLRELLNALNALTALNASGVPNGFSHLSCLKCWEFKSKSNDKIGFRRAYVLEIWVETSSLGFMGARFLCN